MKFSMWPFKPTGLTRQETGWQGVDSTSRSKVHRWLVCRKQTTNNLDPSSPQVRKKKMVWAKNAVGKLLHHTRSRPRIHMTTRGLNLYTHRLCPTRRIGLTLGGLYVLDRTSIVARLLFAVRLCVLVYVYVCCVYVYRPSWWASSVEAHVAHYRMENTLLLSALCEKVRIAPDTWYDVVNCVQSS